MADPKPGEFKFEPTSDKHYEDKFEFPFWKLIKQRAEEKDISYCDAILEVLPEYQKNIRYRDEEWADGLIRGWHQVWLDLAEREAKQGKIPAD